MRLIDADDLQTRLYKLMEQGELSFEVFAEVTGVLDEQPIAYDVDKVVEKVEKKAEDSRKYWNEFDDEGAFGEMNAYSNAVKIIKSGGV